MPTVLQPCHCAENTCCYSVAATLSQVRFSTKSFGLEAAGVAAEALKAVAQSLTHADMSDIIAGRPVSDTLTERGRHTQQGHRRWLLLCQVLQPAPSRLEYAQEGSALASSLSSSRRCV